MRWMRPLAIAVDIISAVVVLSATLSYDELRSVRPVDRPRRFLLQVLFLQKELPASRRQ